MQADHAAATAAAPASASSAPASSPAMSLHRSSTGVRVALVGCGHGELDAMYSCVRHLQSAQGLAIDLLICCGDFQAVRNYSDLECMACPAKYRALNTFYKYYTGEATAPCMTIFIGGNHEASNYLVELFHGGWVAPSIYYLGFSGVVNFGGLRIGGLSGIYNDRHLHQGHYEHAPFDGDAMRSVYHVREYDVWKLSQISRAGEAAMAAAAAASGAPQSTATPAASAAAPSAPLDIFLSHDWPRNIAHAGDTRELIRRKKFLASEIADGSLGSPPAEKLLHLLKPRYWFSAHMHVKFAAVVRHEAAVAAAAVAAASAPAGAAPGAASSAAACTQFLALDKCLPHREYMQLLDFPAATGPKVLQYDAEWLAVLKATQPFLSLQRQSKPLPTPPRNAVVAALSSASGGVRYDYRPTAEEVAWVTAKLSSRCADSTPGFHPSAPLAVPLNFARTAEGWHEGQPTRGAQQPSDFQINPQTSALLNLLEIEDTITPAYRRGGGGGGYQQHHQQQAQAYTPHQQSQPYQTASYRVGPSGSAYSNAALSLVPSQIHFPPSPQQSQSQHAQKKPRVDDDAAAATVPAAASASSSTAAAMVPTHNPDEIDLDALDDVESEEPHGDGECCGSMVATGAAAVDSAPAVAVADQPMAAASKPTAAATTSNAEEIQLDEDL